MTNTITLHVGDVRDIQTTLPAGSVDLVVTSPPFLALRSYLPADHPDKHREIGSEATPAAYLSTLLALTREWRRILAPHGSICVELGDTYSGAAGYGDPDSVNPAYAANGGERYRERYEGRTAKRFKRKDDGWPLAKSLCLIPSLYAASLAYGHNLLNPAHTIRPWRVRNLLTWTRPNPPVGALGDKFRPATSFVTVACTSDKRWFDLDAVRVPYTENTLRGGTNGGENHKARTAEAEGTGRRPTVPGDVRKLTHAGAPPLDWHDDNQPDWQPLHNLPTHPFRGSHYATFNPALPRRLIEAMCPREVCTVCGEPRRRIAETTNSVGHAVGRTAWTRDSATTALMHSGAITMDINHVAPDRAERHTLGWTECSCERCIHMRLFEDCIYECQKYRRGHVLDPFAGSGTTAIAAASVGRDTILCDLDHRNIDLIRQRITETMRIVSETVDGDTWTWTVTPASKQEVANIAAGQETLW